MHAKQERRNDIAAASKIYLHPAKSSIRHSLLFESPRNLQTSHISLRLLHGSCIAIGYIEEELRSTRLILSMQSQRTQSFNYTLTSIEIDATIGDNAEMDPFQRVLETNIRKSELESRYEMDDSDIEFAGTQIDYVEVEATQIDSPIHIKVVF